MAECNYDYHYIQEGATELTRSDLYKLFENYRTWKYIIGMLIMLGKTKFPEYKILDVGCGAGDNLRFMTELRVKPENCYGIDLSRKAIDLCRALSPEAMHFQLGSALALPYAENTFDIVLCFTVLECFEDSDVRNISRSLRRIMKTGSILLVVDINERFINAAANKEFLKQARSFNFETEELEQLLFTEFSVFKKIYINGGFWHMKDGKPADIKDLPYIDAELDKGPLSACFSLYSFVAK